MKTNMWKGKNHNNKLLNPYGKLPHKNNKYPLFTIDDCYKQLKCILTYNLYTHH